MNTVPSPATAIAGAKQGGIGQARGWKGQGAKVSRVPCGNFTLKSRREVAAHAHVSHSASRDIGGIGTRGHRSYGRLVRTNQQASPPPRANTASQRISTLSLSPASSGCESVRFVRDWPRSLPLSLSTRSQIALASKHVRTAKASHDSHRHLHGSIRASLVRAKRAAKNVVCDARAHRQRQSNPSSRRLAERMARVVGGRVLGRSDTMGGRFNVGRRRQTPNKSLEFEYYVPVWEHPPFGSAPPPGVRER